MGTRLLRAIIAVVLVAVSLVAITVQPASAINQSATGVLGQGVSFTSSTGNTTVTGMKAPSGVALDTVNHRLFVADKTNNRVLEFDCDNSNCSRRRYCRPRAGPIAFYYKRYRLTQSTLNTPIGLVFDSSNNRLYVADSTNNRILVFNTSTIIDGMNAAYVIGQANFTSNAATVDNATLNGPQYMDLDAAGNRLFVADAIHNRILIWNVSSISNGMIANNVLGQSTFSASAIATTQGGTSTPTGVAYDATAQNLYVTESGNRRVVVYAVGSVTDGMNANYVIGQSTFTSNTSATTQAGLGATVGAVAVDPATHKLYVVDTGNSRVMGYDTSTLSNGPNAVDVIGQSSFTGGTGGTSKLAINGPTGIGYDAGQKRLYVADTTSNRTVWYDLPQATPAASLLGQSGSFSANAASTTSTGMNGAAGSAVDTTNHRLFCCRQNKQSRTRLQLQRVKMCRSMQPPTMCLVSHRLPPVEQASLNQH